MGYAERPPSWQPAALSDLGPEVTERWEPATPDTTYPVSGYQRRFGLDLIQGGVAFDPDFGGGGGGQIAFSDLLNNEQILLFIANEGGSGGSFLDSFDVGLTYYNSRRRLNWALGAFRLARTYNADLDLYLQESRLGGVFLASYPLSRFNRIETSLVVRRITNHLYRSGVQSDTYFVSNLFSYVHDSTLWSRIGPFDGSRYGVTLGLTTDLGAGIGDYVSVLGDYRWYRRLVGDMTYALRGQGRVSFGEEGQRYYVGGAVSLRGYPYRSVAGQRLLLLNQEIRFPLVQRLVVAMPTGPMDLPIFYGSCFADMAWAGDDVWSERFFGSVGVGFFVGGGPYPRLRVDLAWPTDFHSIADHADTEFSVGFGY
jgi:outer membrane protein assembly factor BamA